ncbi:MAG: hypothetical protein C0513_04355 [Isosphaera sp.]|nr:hypothetical protein [Isosphaera sp.]
MLSGALPWLILIALAVGVSVLLTAWLLRRGPARFRDERVTLQLITERVRAVGKLVGLEVYAKEIATATSGLSWLPPLLLSHARLAMIFHFEKQYYVDLARVRLADAAQLPDGAFLLRLPPLQGQLRLIDVTPYDVQGGKVLGLVDVIAMNAQRQADLMRRAQQQASELYQSSDPRYLAEARSSIERHLHALLSIVGARAQFQWDESQEPSDRAEPLAKAADA